MCPYLSANYVSDCPLNMAQVSVWPDNLHLKTHKKRVPSGTHIKQESVELSNYRLLF